MVLVLEHFFLVASHEANVPRDTLEKWGLWPLVYTQYYVWGQPESDWQSWRSHGNPGQAFYSHCEGHYGKKTFLLVIEKLFHPNALAFGFLRAGDLCPVIIFVPSLPSKWHSAVCLP